MHQYPNRYIALPDQRKIATNEMNVEVAYYNASKHFVEMRKEQYIEQHIYEEQTRLWRHPYSLYDALPHGTPELRCFPDDLRNITAAFAHEFDMQEWEVILAALGAVAIVSHGRYQVQIYPTWIEAVALNVILAKAPGSRKSALLETLLTPLREWEQEQRKGFTEVKSEICKDIYRERKKQIRPAIQGALQNGDPEQIRALIQGEGQKLQALKETMDDRPLPVLSVACCTVKALEQELVRQGGAIGICAAEDPFTILGLRDKSTAIAGLLNSSYDMSDYFRPSTNRASTSIYKTAVSMLIAMQPDVLLSYYDKQYLKDDGFLDRLIVCFMQKTYLPDNSTRHQTDIQFAVSHYNEKMRQIIKRNFTQAPQREIYTLKVSGEALQILLRNKEELDRYLSRSTPQADGFLRKHAGRVVRMAACLHLWRYDNPQDILISDLDMAAAIELGRTLERHAEYAFDSHTRKFRKDAQRVLDYIDRTGWGGFTVTDISHNLSEMPKNKLLPVLDYLEDNGYLRQIHIQGRATICLVNPAVHKTRYTSLNC